MSCFNITHNLGASALSPNNNIGERNELENNGNYDPRDISTNGDGHNIKHENGGDKTVDQVDYIASLGQR